MLVTLQSQQAEVTLKNHHRWGEVCFFRKSSATCTTTLFKQKGLSKKMEQKELTIISHLRKDARTSLASISHSVEMPISTIYDKINRLHQENLIKKYTTLVDFKKLGFHHQVKLALKIPSHQKKELLEFLKEHQCVNSLYEVNNGFDFLVETIHKGVKEHLSFMEELQECFDILEMHEYQIVDEIEREKFL